MNNSPTSYDIWKASTNLNFKVKGKPADRRQADNAIVVLGSQIDTLDRLALAYYSNQLAAHFCLESIFITAINYLDQIRPSGIPLKELTRVTSFLNQMFRNEFLNLDQETLDDT